MSLKKSFGELSHWSQYSKKEVLTKSKVGGGKGENESLRKIVDSFFESATHFIESRTESATHFFESATHFSSSSSHRKAWDWKSRTSRLKFLQILKSSKIKTEVFSKVYSSKC